MTRIADIFNQLKAQNQKALMPYLTAGDPNLEMTEHFIPAIEKAGAHICEIGVPFSDPIADGPVIQASMNHALENQFTIDRLLESISRVRPNVNLGLIAMASYSLVHRYGLKTFLHRSKQAGFDGFIFPDLPVEQSEVVREMAASEELTISFLISPSTDAERAAKIAQACTGFVYVLSRSGLTGERSEIPESLAKRLHQLRNFTDLPLAVGFGISSSEQVKQVVAQADAAIVGSAIMKQIATSRRESPSTQVDEVRDFVKELASGLH